MSLKSVYAKRFYELLNGKKKPIHYSIEELKAMFQVENKYNRTDKFINRVIEPERKEL